MKPESVTIDRQTATIAFYALRDLLSTSKGWAEVPGASDRAKSIYNRLLHSIQTLEEALAVELPDRGSMPRQLSMLGCGKHEFERQGDNYYCPRCSIRIHPGQILYAELKKWMGDE